MGQGQVVEPAAVRHKLHDDNVTLEEYLYYAKIQRDQERAGLDPLQRGAIANGSELVSQETVGGEKYENGDEKSHQVVTASSSTTSIGNTQIAEDWENASRLARTASWGSMLVSTIS
jgi:hypothetical protein